MVKFSVEPHFAQALLCSFSTLFQSASVSIPGIPSFLALVFSVVVSGFLYACVPVITTLISFSTAAYELLNILAISLASTFPPVSSSSLMCALRLLSLSTSVMLAQMFLQGVQNKFSERYAIINSAVFGFIPQVGRNISQDVITCRELLSEHTPRNSRYIDLLALCVELFNFCRNVSEMLLAQEHSAKRSVDVFGCAAGFAFSHDAMPSQKSRAANPRSRVAGERPSKPQHRLGSTPGFPVCGSGLSLCGSYKAQWFAQPVYNPSLSFHQSVFEQLSFSFHKSFLGLIGLLYILIIKMSSRKYCRSIA